MNTLLSEDQAELESFCQKLLAKEWPLDKAIKTLAPGGARHSPELWKTLVDAGWLGLPFSSELGGADGTLIDLGLVYRAAGERLVPSTFYSCMFAELLIAKIGTPEQQAAMLPPIIRGERIATVAYSEPQAAEDARFFEASAARSPDGWTLAGIKAFVPNLETADFVLVLAKTRVNSDRSGWGLFSVGREHIAGRSKKYSTFGSEALFELKLDGLQLPADALLGGDASLSTTLDRFSDTIGLATALQCMEAVGGISTVLARTTEYVSGRKQSGRPLGSNQAVQHLLANVAIQLDGARVAALQALFLKSRGDRATREVAIAKIATSEAYVHATTIAQQLWGSMGYARETGLYLWSERARVTDAWFGSRNAHLGKLAAQMGL